MAKGGIYKGGKKHRAAVKAQFTKRYGKKGGKKGKGGAYVYGAVVGNIWRAQHPGRHSWNQKR